MGTPAFAVPSLDILRSSGYQVKAVVTAPDKPAGRGLKLHKSEVKQYAEKHKLPIFQPVSLKDENFIKQLEQLFPDLFVVVAFRMLPEKIWRMPPYGAINLHASLLPQYRGAAPINHAIINGEQITGVTTFLIDRQIDTGKILLREIVEVGPEETAGELHDRLMHSGAKLVLKTVDQLREGTANPVSQNDYLETGVILNTAPKLTKEFCAINWNEPAFRIVNLIRGLSPYPAAHTTLCSPSGEQYPVKIYNAKLSDQIFDIPAGSVVSDAHSKLFVVTTNGSVELIELQPAGKIRMKSKDFVNGYRVSQGWKVC